MYIIYNINDIYHLFNEPKLLYFCLDKKEVVEAPKSN